MRGYDWAPGEQAADYADAMAETDPWGNVVYLDDPSVMVGDYVGPEDYDGPDLDDNGYEIQSDWLSPEIAGGNPEYTLKDFVGDLESFITTGELKGN